MSIQEDFDEILDYAHFWNWAPDWGVAREIYAAFPNSFSVLTPFAYSYLEEMIRSMTSEYGVELPGKKRRKVGLALINLAIEENAENELCVAALERVKPYFRISSFTDRGDNRNSVLHGYMHPRFWTYESFEGLIHVIAGLSKFSRF